MKKLSRWDNSNEPRSSKSTHAHAISFHETFARKRTRTNRSNAFYRSFAFAKFFHIAAFARFGAIFCSFREKKRFFKIHFSWKPTKQTRASERVQRATRESRERERKESESRAIEREREREHVPVDLRAVCFVRAMLTF